MTTPPSDPDHNPWAAPAGPPPSPQPGQYGGLYDPPVDPRNPRQDPFAAFPSGPVYPQPQQQPGAQSPIGLPNYPAPVLPVAPQPSTGAGVKLGIALTVFALILGGVIFWVATKDDMKFGGGADTTPVITTTTTTTTTTAPKAFATVGDCVKLGGSSFTATYDKLDCAQDRHNYTVSKLPARDEKCGEDKDTYTLYTKGRDRVCLIPVFRDGVCYQMGIGVSLNAEIPVAECGGYGVVKARVLRDTWDKATCGEGQALALAYPEIRTTYCFTHTF